MTCPACLAVTPDEAQFCPRCGAPISNATERPTVYTPSPDDLTRAPSDAPAQVRRSVTPPPGSDPRIGGRFPPGTLLAGRYRIVGLLGRGGMGEVYRADDLTLGQVVALKFLPQTLVSDPEWLTRFRGEVRAARQVSHPNVCRVYDIGDADGQTFLSMEYVGGEDLATLLRRIGRISPDKAAEMGRGLCAGLSAAHDKGVLHRDLKPANVLIDEQGRVRLADFGLAGGELPQTSGLVGTPAYMAPELFDGTPASIKSDLYALGLVLYELFSGKVAVSGESVADLARQHRETPPATLTAVVAEIDQVADRIIRRCLEKDPDRRPTSALQVAAALPGGDPLAAALAAGETPSPEMVAASGGVGTVSPRIGLTLLASVAIGVACAIFMNGRTQVANYLPLSRSPEVLADAAHGIAERLGYREPFRDAAWGFTITDYLQYLIKNDPSPSRWENLRPGQPPAVTFWYRQSPTELSTDSFFLGGQVSATNPPVVAPGMVNLMLDLKGRLHYLVATPPRKSTTAGAQAYDWSVLLREAGFNPAVLKPAPAIWTPPFYSESRMAWDGVYPDRPDISVHVEAAATGGRPVYFQIFEPWSVTTLGTPLSAPGVTLGGVLGVVVPTLVLVGAILLARRNVRLERADHAGAMRVAIVLLLANVVSGLLTAHHVLSPIPILLSLAVLLARGTLLGSLAYVVYLALEPDVRRRSPQTLVSWSRIISGGLRDPLVGRDLLIGAALGVGIQILRQLQALSPVWIGRAPNVSQPPNAFDGSVQHTLAHILGESANATLVATGLLLMFVLMMSVLRRRRLAGICFVVILFAANATQTTQWIQLPFSALLVAVVVLTVARLGMLPLVVGEITQTILYETPLRVHPGSWLAPASFTAVIFVAGLALFGLRTSLAGQKLFADRLD